MSLPIGVDLVSEVIRNGDPVRQRQAAARLERFAIEAQVKVEPANASGKAETALFDKMLREAPKPAQTRNFNLPAGALQAHRIEPASMPVSGGSGTVEKAAREYEGMFLQQMLQFILPKQGDGSGSDALAGDVARSQLASALGQQLARTGDFGIAEQIVAAKVDAAPPVISPLAQTATGSTGNSVLEVAVNDAQSVKVRTDAVTLQLPASKPQDDTRDVAPAAGEIEPVSAFASFLGKVETFFAGIGGTRLASEQLRHIR